MGSSSNHPDKDIGLYLGKRFFYLSVVAFKEYCNFPTSIYDLRGVEAGITKGTGDIFTPMTITITFGIGTKSTVSVLFRR